VFGIAEQISAGLVSIVTVMIGMIGWRYTYIEVGIFFVALGFISLLVIKEPYR